MSDLKAIKQERFLDKIEKDLKKLYELPIYKLEILEKYYQYSIEQYENELAKLKKQ